MAAGLTPQGPRQAILPSGSRHRPGWATLPVVGLALVLVSCGRGSATGDASASRTQSPSPPIASPSPSPSGVWQAYTDQQYGFSISYPPDFTMQSQGTGPPGGLQVYRAVDNKYVSGYPPGQVELGIYTMDAETLSAWVAKHTGPAEAPSSQGHYWATTTNLTSA